MKIFSGSSNVPLAANLAKKLNTKLADVERALFPNGEIRVWVKEEVRRENVILVQSFSDPVDFHIIEFTLIVDALQRCGARKIVGVIPWLGYSLQDKVFRPGEPIAAKVIADFVSRGVKRHILVNLHSDSITGFFPVPATQVSALDMFVDYVKRKNTKDTLVISPDFGAIKRARVFARKLELPLANINKERHKVTGQITAHGVSHSVKGKECLVIDDVVSTGDTLIKTAKLLKEQDAKRVRFFATHALFCHNASKRLSKSDIDEVVVTDTVAIPKEKQFKKLTVLSIAPVLIPEIEVWA